MKKFISFFLFISFLFSQTLTSQEINQMMIDYLKNRGNNPGTYLIESFEKYDVIFLAEEHIIKQNLVFVQDLIPELYKNGIYILGMEFGASEDQSTLDSLINAPAYNEELAKKLMFDYNVAWAFKEYVDIYKKTWELNQTLPHDAPKFRVINLSYQYNWEAFDGSRTPESMKKVFYKGTADKFRADLIEENIINKNQKMLALVGTPHAYTRYATAVFNYNSDNFMMYDDYWLGNRLYKKYPTRVFSIMLHQAFSANRNGNFEWVSPANGNIEMLMKENNFAPVGFDLIKSPIGKLTDSSNYSVGYEDFTMEQLFDGYIFLKPLNELSGCTVIKDFVNESNIEEALRNFPDPDWHADIKSLEDVKTFIENEPDRIEKEFASVYYDKKLVAILENIYTEDQKYRVELGKTERLYGRDSDEMTALWDTIHEKDAQNEQKITEILDNRGWLGPDSIGERGSLTLFLVIQHAAIETQEKYLPMMQEAAKTGNANPANLALLEDRIAMRQGKKQIYGSQIMIDPETGEYYVSPIENPDNVDKRRAEVGLQPMADYISIWNLTWDVEKHKQQCAEMETIKRE